MKKQTKSNLLASLQSLGIIFLIFFAMAFACKDGGEGNPTPNGDRSNRITTGGRCSTEAEFKAIITHDLTYLARNYEKKEVIFHSFKVGSPRHYENYQEYYLTNTNNAYPVTTDFDVITRGDAMGSGRIYRDRYEQSLYMCYTVTSKNTCVCFGEKNNLPVVRGEEVTGDY